MAIMKFPFHHMTNITPLEMEASALNLSSALILTHKSTTAEFNVKLSCRK